MDFLPHFEEFRKRFIVCLLVFAAAAAACYLLSHKILNILTWPLYKYTAESLVFQKPYEAFMIHIKSAAFAGLILASPVILTQSWLFVAPALCEKEKKIFLPVITVSILLFLAGILFSYYLVIPWGLKMMLSFQTEELQPMLSAASYFSFLTGMLLAFGVLFDFPVILVGLGELGLIKSSWLAGVRRPMVVIIFIVSAVLTPSPDPISQILLAVPLWLLFEVSLMIIRKREQQKKLTEGAAGSVDTTGNSVV